MADAPDIAGNLWRAGAGAESAASSAVLRRPQEEA